MFQSKSRLESFSDSIFAFAATLLVVSLNIPETFEALKTNLISFFSFGFSFLALVLLWKTHNNLFRRIKIIDNWVVMLNMLLLFVILFYVYPLKFLTNLPTGISVIGSVEELSELFQIYGLGFILIFLCFSMIYAYQYKVSNEVSYKSTMKYYAGFFFIFVLMGIISIIMAKLNIGVKYGLPGFIYALVGIPCYLYGKKFDYLLKDTEYFE